MPCATPHNIFLGVFKDIFGKMSARNLIFKMKGEFELLEDVDKGDWIEEGPRSV